MARSRSVDVSDTLPTIHQPGGVVGNSDAVLGGPGPTSVRNPETATAKRGCVTSPVGPYTPPFPYVHTHGALVCHARRMESIDLTGFTCPRCSRTVSDEYYGPCAQCRDELKATFEAEGRDVAPTEYEPKMNVTPNAVALKD